MSHLTERDAFSNAQALPIDISKLHGNSRGYVAVFQPKFGTKYYYFSKERVMTFSAVHKANMLKLHLLHTGIGAAACLRHGCFVPHSVVDFQKRRAVRIVKEIIIIPLICAE